MVDPTADEVAAAIATLQAFEAARESHVKSSELIPPPPTASVAVEPTPETPVTSVAPAVDPYVARSVKSSPNGF